MGGWRFVFFCFRLTNFCQKSFFYLLPGQYPSQRRRSPSAISAAFASAAAFSAAAASAAAFSALAFAAGDGDGDGDGDLDFERRGVVATLSDSMSVSEAESMSHD